MTEQAIYNVVLYYAQKISVGRIAPHDLRRTLPRWHTKAERDLIRSNYRSGMDRSNNGALLGAEQDLTDAPCDHLGLRL
jgi:hypothetical protein